MRTLLRLAPALVLLAPAAAQAPAFHPDPAPEDPVLADLLKEALDRDPSLHKAAAQVRMDQEKVPQARALPDPTLSLGMQNDGFNRIQVGRMETSFYSVAFTQPFPWPGKRGLRQDVAALGVKVSETAETRARLGLEADVRRGYAALLLVRGQLALLKDQALFLDQAERLARTRYEVGQGSQADLLRAQLEKTRLEQARFGLEAEERAAVADLNRLRLHDSADPIPTTAALADLPEPPRLTPEEVEARSPEMAAAQLGVEQTRRLVDLAKLDRRPDFAITAGIMPRGSFDPMWQVGLSLSLPIYGRSKQQRALAEHEHHLHAQNADVMAVRSLLDQRTAERLAQIEALEKAKALYEQGLLVQSEASFRATLAQYEAGRTGFLAALEALNGWVGDRGGYLQTLAQLQAQGIALGEASLAPTVPITGGAMGAASIAAGSSPAVRAGASAAGGSAKGQDAGPAPMSRM